MNFVYGALGTPRLSSLPLRLSGACLLLLAAGCSARGTEPFTSSVSEPYHVDRCGGFTGATAMLGTSCNGTDELVEASCDVIGGEVEDAGGRGSSWSCSTTWPDAERGGAICVHLVCRRTTADVTVAVSCSEPDGAPARCFGP